MSIDIKTAKRVAHLARIEAQDGDLDQIAGEINKVLDMIDELQLVDVEGIEPMTSVLPANAPQRQDKVTTVDIQSDILANAPLSREGFFAVPKVVE